MQTKLMDKRVFEKIGPYRILNAIHKGPRPLYRAESPDGQLVAIKAMEASTVKAEERERFMREAETCRLLNHPNLIRVYDLGEADGMLYQAMELLEGADLEKVMSSPRKFSWDEKLDVMEQVCAGLAHAHDHKLVHRDVKPSNLFLQTSGQVKVLDFGMVRLADSHLTRPGSALGTLNYMSPEQIQAEPCTAASDVFSAGMVFYQLSSGIHPFSKRDQNFMELVSAILFSSPPELRKICPDAPEGLEAVLERALQKKPERRYENAGDFQHAIGLCRTLASQFVPDSSSQGSPTVADAKTVVIRRPKDVGVIGTIRPVVSTPPAALPAPPPAPRVRYCPVCTQPIPAGAEDCPNCGQIVETSNVSQGNDLKRRVLYGLLAISVLLVITLVIVLMMR